MRYLPLFCEPLRSILAFPPHITHVPVKWYYTILVPYYTEEDRIFSKWAQEYAPDLFKAFLAADISLLCRDQQITTTDIRGFARVKYHLCGGQIAQHLEIPSLQGLLDFVRRNPSWTDNRYCGRITVRTDGEGRSAIYHHFHAVADHAVVRRSDMIIALYRSTLQSPSSPVPGASSQAQSVNAEPPAQGSVSYLGHSSPHMPTAVPQEPNVECPRQTTTKEKELSPGKERDQQPSQSSTPIPPFEKVRVKLPQRARSRHTSSHK